MAFVYALDPTAPANTDLVKDGAADMRLIKNALIERVQSFFQNVDSDPWVAKAGVTFAGNFTQSAGTASLQATTCTTLTATSNVAAGAAAQVRWTGRTILTAPADGQLLATDNAGTAFTRMMFGGTTSSYPAITRSAAALHFKLADDSAFANVQALGATFGGAVSVTAGGISVTGGITGTLSTAAQPNVTSVGTLTSLTVTVGVDSIVLNGSPTNGPQIKLGNSSVFGAVGSRYSNGNSFLSSNAYQTTTGVDSWTQSSGAFKSVLFDLDYASGIRLLSANAGAAVANFATFWGSAVFTVTNAGVGTFAAGLNVNAGTAAVQALTATTGTFSSTLTTAAAFAVASGQRIYLDGVAATGDTYITEVSANTLRFTVGGAAAITTTATRFAVEAALDLSLEPTKKLYLDGGGDTYIAETAANKLDIIAGGATMFRAEATRTNVFGDFIIPAASKLYIDGSGGAGGDTYLIETAGNQLDIFAGTVNTIRTTATLVSVLAVDFAVPAAKKLYLDGGSNTYLLENAADDVYLVTGAQNGFRQVKNGANTDIYLYNLNTSVSAANLNITTDKVTIATSKREHKADIRDLTMEEARHLIFASKPRKYRSLCASDDPEREFVGFIFDEVEELDPRFVADKSVFYPFYVVPMTLVLQDHETRLSKAEKQLATLVT